MPSFSHSSLALACFSYVRRMKKDVEECTMYFEHLCLLKEMKCMLTHLARHICLFGGSWCFHGISHCAL